MQNSSVVKPSLLPGTSILGFQTYCHTFAEVPNIHIQKTCQGHEGQNFLGSYLDCAISCLSDLGNLFNFYEDQFLTLIFEELPKIVICTLQVI